MQHNFCAMLRLPDDAASAKRTPELLDPMAKHNVYFLQELSEGFLDDKTLLCYLTHVLRNRQGFRPQLNTRKRLLSTKNLGLC